MKKLLFVLALGAFAACGSGSTTATTTDTAAPAVVADTTAAAVVADTTHADTTKMAADTTKK